MTSERLECCFDLLSGWPIRTEQSFSITGYFKYFGSDSFGFYRNTRISWTGLLSTDSRRFPYFLKTGLFAFPNVANRSSSQVPQAEDWQPLTPADFSIKTFLIWEKRLSTESFQWRSTGEVLLACVFVEDCSTWTVRSNRTMSQCSIHKNRKTTPAISCGMKGTRSTLSSRESLFQIKSVLAGLMRDKSKKDEHFPNQNFWLITAIVLIKEKTS